MTSGGVLSTVIVTQSTESPPFSGSFNTGASLGSLFPAKSLASNLMIYSPSATFFVVSHVNDAVIFSLLEGTVSGPAT